MTAVSCAGLSLKNVSKAKVAALEPFAQLALLTPTIVLLRYVSLASHVRSALAHRRCTTFYPVLSSHSCVICTVICVVPFRVLAWRKYAVIKILDTKNLELFVRTEGEDTVCNGGPVQSPKSSCKKANARSPGTSRSHGGIFRPATRG